MWRQPVPRTAPMAGKNHALADVGHPIRDPLEIMSSPEQMGGRLIVVGSAIMYVSNSR